jgi:eukaryotic-like serine/threonine-protein kinase
MTLTAGTHLGPYEILSPLGAGGMGEVYRARDTRLARDVALKTLIVEAGRDAERFRRFKKEAESTAALSHPNIVAIFDIGEERDIPYIVSELVPGGTLRDLLDRGPLPIRKLLELAAGIAEGLAAAHAAGIVHRDLKPDNVLLTADGRPKIADFGLAKYFRAGSDPEGSQLTTLTDDRTKEGTILGTVGYMSPEQASGRPLDFRSDQFSFGSILYEMATGQRAFRGETKAETLAAIIREEPEPIEASNPAIPAPFRWIVERCLAKEPKDRYDSTGDLASELKTLRDHLSEAAPPAGAPAAARLRPSVVVAVILGFALLVAGGLLGRLVFNALPAPPSFQRLTFRRGEVMAARFAPDGQTVVYSFSSGGGPEDIYSLRAGSPEFRAQGLRGAQLLAVSSQGELAVALHWKWGGPDIGYGTLARVSLAGGAPRQLLDDVIDADWSPDGREMAILRAVERGRRIEFPAGKILYETKGLPFLVEVRVSRRADAVTFIELDRGNGVFSVHVMDLAGTRRKLTDGWKEVRGMAWSRDGKEVWFTASRAGEGKALHAVTLSGKERVVARSPGGMRLQDISPDGRVLLTQESIRREMAGRLSGDTDDRDLSWLDYSWPSDFSSDGKRLLFVEGGAGSGRAPTLWLKTVGEPVPVRLGEGGAGSALSPDGKWVAAVRIRAGRPNELGLVPTGAGEERRIELGSFSPESATFLPGGAGRLLVGGQLADGKPGLYLVELSDASSSPLAPEGWRWDAISPDGKWILCHRQEQLALFPLEGGVARPLSLPDARREDLEKLGALDNVAGWADDDHTVFTSTSGVPGRLFRLDLRTFRATLWREVTPPDVAGVRAVSPNLISPDGKSYVYTFRRVLSDLYLAEGLK